MPQYFCACEPHGAANAAHACAAIATLVHDRAAAWRSQPAPHLAPPTIKSFQRMQIILSVAAALVAFSSIVLGKFLNLAYSAKLYAIAFLIVTFGAVDEETTDTR